MTSIIIWAVLIIVVTILLIKITTQLSRYKQKRKTSDVYLQLYNLARENNLHLSESQIIKDQVLGIDGLSCKLVFAKINEKNELIWEIIDLYGVKGCSIYKTHDTDQNNQGDKKLFHIKEMGIQLQFYYNRDPVNLIFYQHILDYAHQLPGAENTADKWETIICRKLKSANFPGRYRALA